MTWCCNHLTFATGSSVGLRGLQAQIVDRTSRTHASRAISDMDLVLATLSFIALRPEPNSYLDNGYILRMRDLEWSRGRDAGYPAPPARIRTGAY